MIFQNFEERNVARHNLAVKCVNDGNLAAANILCCNILDRQEDHALAWNLLGIIGAKLHLWKNAAEFFQVAGNLGLTEAQVDLKEISASTAVGAPPPASEERFLLIKSWGAGFWSDVSHVLGGLILAEVTGRRPVVHWGCNSHFSDGTSRDAFALFFEPISTLKIHDLVALDGADFFPRKWSAENLLAEDHAKWFGEGAQLDAIYLLNRRERIVVADFYVSIANFAPWIPPDHSLARLPVADLYRHAIQKYFRPQSGVLEEAKAFFVGKLSGLPFVAAHIRGSDKVGECTFTSDSEEFLSYVTGETYKILDQVDRSYRIFLMTDDHRIARKTIGRYGERVIMTPSQRTESDRGVHFLDSVDHPRLGVEVMIDVFLALQATAFIGIGGSNVAAMIALLRDWPEKRCVLIGPSLLLRRGQMPYLDKAHRELETPDMDAG